LNKTPFTSVFADKKRFIEVTVVDLPHHFTNTRAIETTPLSIPARILITKFQVLSIKDKNKTIKNIFLFKPLT